LNGLIHRGEIAAIVSRPGVGKTYLGIDIAKNPHLGKVVFLELDDTNGTQSKRFEIVPNLHVITAGEWKRLLQLFKEEVKTQIDTKVNWDKYLSSEARITDRKERLQKEFGINTEKRIDNLMLYERTMQLPIVQDADAVIIDSLNSLLGSPDRVQRRNLERIISPFKDTGKTLIILHHINKEGEIAGSSAFSEMMDLVVKLDSLDGGMINIQVMKSRFPQGLENCVAEMIRETDHSVRFEICKEEIQCLGKPKLEVAILDQFGEKEMLAFSDLCKTLADHKYCNRGSIENALKRLEDKSYISKADGKTWATIKKLDHKIEI
jgi:archaellum biogenesis ATPase FlaH